MLIAVLFISINAFAQENTDEAKAFGQDPFNSSMLPLYLVTAFVAVLIILVAVVAIYLIGILNMLTEQAKKEQVEKQGIIYVPTPSWWSKFTQTVNASVPVAEEKNIELDHNYDGIKELDNHLPPWWKWLFLGTIAWSVVYLFVFHISKSLPLSGDEYQNEIVLAEEQARKLKASQPMAEIDENALTFTKDSISFITQGKNVFMNSNCGSCHRQDGGGNAIGPNLTDAYWLHGGHVKNIFTAIKIGVVEKGMPAWGKSLSAQQVRDVAFFIMSLQGSNPANAKAPQGDVYKEPTVLSDTLKTQASL